MARAEGEALEIVARHLALARHQHRELAQGNGEAVDIALDLARAQVGAQIECGLNAGVVETAQLLDGEERQKDADHPDDPGCSPHGE